MQGNSDPRSMFTNEEISGKYDAFAPRYDLAVGLLEILGMRRLRKKLLRQTSGDVLEIGVGTGKNLLLYPSSCKITAIDLSSGMMEIARRKAARRGLEVDFQLLDAESLKFADEGFDTVVDTLGTCSFTDPVGAFREMARVCKKGGRILLLEHGRSNGKWLGHFQDWRAESHAKALGCVWNREPLELVNEARLSVIASRRSFFGIFHSIIATP